MTRRLKPVAAAAAGALATLPTMSQRTWWDDGGAASMVVSLNPLQAPAQGEPVTVGRSLASLAPVTDSPLVLRVNGQWLLRADWWRPVLPGDVIEWHVLPMGGNNGASRTLLQIIVVIVAIVYAYYTGDYQGALQILSIGFALTNALIPIKHATPNGPSSPESVYTVTTAANQARLSQPIPVIYGRMLTFPDYAGQPYAEFDKNDQYFFAVYCIGQGAYTVERLQIDDTPLSHFSDVQYEVLPPGSAPTLALSNVVNAPEVAGQTLLSGRYVGGFAACGPKSSAASIGIDVNFPKGLGLADNTGAIGDLSIKFRTDARPVDDFGSPTGAWYALGTETVTRKTSTPQRLSFRYTLPSAGRVEVRMARLDILNPSANALHDIVWSGLRAYLSAAAPLCATATHMAVKIRASDQLNGLSQRRINGIWRRKLRTWSPGGGWGPLVETRNPMWARLDKLSNTVYGDGLADARIDLQTHADLAAIYDARQDHLDILFDTRVTSIDADRTICMAGRAVPFQRAGVCTLTRDQLQTLPVTAYTSRDIQPGSLEIQYSLATEITADAVIVEYFDNRSWDWRPILCKAPGVTTPTRPVMQRIMGITGAKHAEREGLYLAAQNVYRRKFPKFTTEMQGLLPAYGSAVLLSPALPGWGQAGDVAYWDLESLTMGLSEPAAFTPGASHFISLRRDDGSVTAAIAVTPGPTAYDVVLASAPDFGLVLDAADRERPRYVFGASGQHRIIARVLGISKKGRSKDGAQSIEIRTVAEDVRVHQVDLALLPGPGEIQDPVGTVGADTGGGSFFLPTLSSRTVSAISTAVLDMRAAFTLSNTGHAYSTTYYAPGGAGTVTDFPTEWMYYGTVETTVAALYEVRATLVDGGAPNVGSAVGVWLSLGSNRTWELNQTAGPVDGSPAAFTSTLFLEIREIGSTVVQASGTVTLFLNFQNYETGFGA